MYESGRLINHDLDRTPKWYLCWWSIENTVCKPRCPTKLVNYTTKVLPIIETGLP